MKKICVRSIFSLILFLYVFLVNAQAYTLPPAKPNHALNEKVEILKKMQEGFTSMVSEVKQAVVFISISKTVSVPEFYYLDPFEEFFGFNERFRRRRSPQTPPRSRKFEQSGLGSGFIIDNKNGYILTNNHVVGDADEIIVHTYDGKKYPAKVIGTDTQTDVAVIQVKNLPSNLNEISFADFAQVQIGDWAVAVGAPHGLDQSITVGIVSAKGRGTLKITGYGDFIQTDAAINPGNSGGPLLNIYGMAIGMNTAIFSQTGGSQGIGFAIPSNILMDVATQLIEKGKIERAYLGVLIQDLDEDLSKEFKVRPGEGVLISSVEPNSPASNVGIQAGDIILRIGGESIRNAEQLSYRVAMSPIGKELKVDVLRKGKEVTFKVPLKVRDEKRISGDQSNQNKNQNQNDNQQSWGMSLGPNLPEFNLSTSKGIVVTQVEENSPASKSGLKERDVILEVNHQQVNSVNEFKKYDTKKDSLLLRIARGEYFLYLTLKKTNE